MKQLHHLTREAHLQHLLKMMPILTFLFGLQCLTLPLLFPGLELGNMYLALAGFIVGGIGSLYFYDTQVKTFLDETHLHWQIPLLKLKKKYLLKELLVIDVLEPEGSFSNIRLVFSKGKICHLLFVDKPAQSAKIILQAKHQATKVELEKVSSIPNLDQDKKVS